MQRRNGNKWWERTLDIVCEPPLFAIIVLITVIAAEIGRAELLEWIRSVR